MKGTYKVPVLKSPCRYQNELLIGQLVNMLLAFKYKPQTYVYVTS